MIGSTLRHWLVYLSIFVGSGFCSLLPAATVYYSIYVPSTGASVSETNPADGNDFGQYTGLEAILGLPDQLGTPYDSYIHQGGSYTRYNLGLSITLYAHLNGGSKIELGSMADTFALLLWDRANSNQHQIQINNFILSGDVDQTFMVAGDLTYFGIQLTANASNTLFGNLFDVNTPDPNTMDTSAFPLLNGGEAKGNSPGDVLAGAQFNLYQQTEDNFFFSSSTAAMIIQQVPEPGIGMLAVIGLFVVTGARFRRQAT